MEILTPEGAVVDAWWSEPERRRVTRLCALITGTPVAAEDLAQETLLEAWRIRDRLLDPSGSRPWLDAIARNVCRRWLVRHGRVRGHEVSTEPPDVGHDELADLLERDELAELLDRALRLLPPETREALVATYVDELGPTEIGRRLRLSPEAVSMRLTRGRARIRELLETELADDPLAQVWVARHGVAWRTVRVSCATCGATSSSMRRDARGGVVQARCERCEPDGLASSWSLDNPALRPHLTAVSRPSAVLGRMADWSHSWWPAAIAAGRVPCTRCGSEVVVRPYDRLDGTDPHVRRGWQASCATCGEVLTTSLLGLTLTAPETRALRARRPRAHAVPTRRAERCGRPALVVGLHDDGSGDRVDALFDDATARPLGVVASR
ncbi:MAG TPA: sigma-70 family RNA polymerase sigma factor [Nocardioides sp.]|uniref:RNA polymerase sigma factor n=1 Tax=Nocardioides sp. TaxID=35761 RepID=UPI002F42C2D7